MACVVVVFFFGWVGSMLNEYPFFGKSDVESGLEVLAWVNHDVRIDASGNEEGGECGNGPAGVASACLYSFRLRGMMESWEGNDRTYLAHQVHISCMSLLILILPFPSPLPTLRFLQQCCLLPARSPLQTTSPSPHSLIPHHIE